MATITDLITEYGAFKAKDGGQTVNNILNQFKVGSVTQNYFPTLAIDGNAYELALSSMSSVLQAFQKAFTAKGGATFKPRRVMLDHIKVDFAETPGDLEASWLAFLTDNSKKKTEYPFIKWLIEEAMRQKNNDMELEAVYKGIYVAPTAGTAGTAAQAFNGLRKQIVDFTSDGHITPIVTGAITASNIIEKVQAFVDGVDAQAPSIFNQMDYVFMSRTLLNWLARAVDTRYAGTRVGEGSLYAEEYTWEGKTFVGLPSMNGSQKIWATPKANRVRLVQKGVPAVDVQGIDRDVKVLTDWWEITTFRDPRLLFANDQA